jgi:hypothetical protein
MCLHRELSPHTPPPPLHHPRTDAAWCCGCLQSCCCPCGRDRGGGGDGAPRNRDPVITGPLPAVPAATTVIAISPHARGDGSSGNNGGGGGGATGSHEDPVGPGKNNRDSPSSVVTAGAVVLASRPSSVEPSRRPSSATAPGRTRPHSATGGGGGRGGRGGGDSHGDGEEGRHKTRTRREKPRGDDAAHRAWRCGACTYVNSSAKAQCAMCHADKPANPQLVDDDGNDVVI